MNRETESAEMRPLAKALTKTLENVRNLLREACLRNNTPNGPLKLNNDELITEMLIESLKIFDRLFAEFELCYVSAMVPVKSTQEYELQELIGVLFSETLNRALKMGLLTQEMIDDYDPALMFTIPRLAIVSGLLMPHGPLCIDKPVEEMSEMFRPFRTLLHKIRELLWTLNKRELFMLEKLLCDNEQITDLKTVTNISDVNSDLDEFVNRFYNDYPTCKDFISNFYTVTMSNGNDVVSADYGNDASELIPDKNETEFPSDVRKYQFSDLEAPINSVKTDNVDIPSTSGYLVANTVTHDSIVASIAEATDPETRSESLPDNDCLEVVSAKLSSILLTEDPEQNSEKHEICCEEKLKKTTKDHFVARNIDNLDSPDDSGICTENTSLDRSPSLDYTDIKSCDCTNNKSDIVGDSSKLSNNHKQLSHQKSKCTYKRTDVRTQNSVGSAHLTRKFKCPPIKSQPNLDKTNEEDNISVGSSDTSSFNSNCADDEEIALAIQAAEIANRNELRSRFR